MRRIGFMIALFLSLTACKQKKSNSTPAVTPVEEEEGDFDYERFSAKFTKASVPYELNDTALLNNKDTATIVSKSILSAIPDSIISHIFLKEGKVKYVAMDKIEVPKAETYFLVRVTQGSKKAALLLTFDKNKQFSAALPFLVPDADDATTQASSIDKNFTITQNILRKEKDVNKEGKEVYIYNNDAKQFTLIMTDLLDEQDQDLINPIDTFPHITKFTGDYIKNKKNIVSIRDSKRPNEIVIFIHVENEEGDCTGELKGMALWVESNKAVYRQGGDPCVLELSFTASAVTLKEQEGCGLHRGLNCSFNGTYPLKKEVKPKKEIKKSKAKGSKST